MSVPDTNDPESTTIAVVAIRIPNSAESDLLSDAEERLSRGGDVGAVTIDELHSIEPKLSAVVITVEITLRWRSTVTDGEIRDRLTSVSGLESILRIG